MQTIWGIVVAGLALLAWGGQLLSWATPETAARLGLTEAADDVDPVYLADIRGEAAWDSLTLWTLLIAGVLLVADIEAWAYFGLVGGGMFLYFAGRGVLTRLRMLRDGVRIGSPSNVRTAFVFLILWGLAGLVTIVFAVAELG